MIRKLRNDGRPIDVSSRLPDLIAALDDVEGLAAVYLYGSYATPDQTPLSDVDLALVFRPDAVPDFDGVLRLVGQATGILEEDDVSVTILNDAPLPHQIEVLRTGRALLVRDDVAHADFVEQVIDRASDFAIDYEAILRDYDEGLRRPMVPVDLGKLRNNMDYIRRTVRRPREVSRTDRAEFLQDDLLQAASIRYLQTAIEAMLDIANHVVAREGLGIPKSYQDAVDLLVTNGVLSKADQETYHRMVRFRNRAVHLYDEIDPAEIHQILTAHLDDFERFLGAVTAKYFGDGS